MHRHALTDQEWERLQAVLPKRRSGPEAIRGDRLFVDAVVYRAKTGMPWRDLPERFGPWKTVYNRFTRWAQRGVWKEIYKALRLRVDKAGSIVDGSIVRAHQDAAGEKGGSTETRWVVLEVDSPRRSTLSSTPRAARSASRSPQGNATK